MQLTFCFLFDILKPFHRKLQTITFFCELFIFNIELCRAPIHGFGHAKIDHVCLALGSCQISILPQLPPKKLAHLKSGQKRLENNHLSLLV